jgi:hypothetical protein
MVQLKTAQHTNLISGSYQELSMRCTKTASKTLEDTATIAVVFIPIASIIASLVTFLASTIWATKEGRLVFGITWCVVMVFVQIIMRKRIMRIITQTLMRGR